MENGKMNARPGQEPVEETASTIGKSLAPPPFQLTTSGVGDPNSLTNGNGRLPSTAPMQKQEGPTSKVALAGSTGNKVETDFGTFEAVKYEETAKRAPDKGLLIHLYFYPKEGKVNATKLGFTQSVKAVVNGKAQAPEPSSGDRMVNSGDGKGYHIDANIKNGDPIYPGTPGNSDLKSHKENQVKTAGDTPELGKNTLFETGYGYLKDGTFTSAPAKIQDVPTVYGNDGDAKYFESTVLALDGADAGKYYGSVSWGFSIGADGKMKIEPLKLASANVPTANFMEAAKLWNNSKVGGLFRLKNDAKGVNFATDTDEPFVKDEIVQMVSTGQTRKGQPTMTVKRYDIATKTSSKEDIVIHSSNLENYYEKGGSSVIQLPTMDILVNKGKEELTCYDYYKPEAKKKGKKASTEETKGKVLVKHPSRIAPNQRVKLLAESGTDFSPEFSKVELLEGNYAGDVVYVMKTGLTKEQGSSK